MPPGNTQVFTVTQPQIYKWSFSFIGGQEDLNSKLCKYQLDCD